MLWLRYVNPDPYNFASLIQVRIKIIWTHTTVHCVPGEEVGVRGECFEQLLLGLLADGDLHKAVLAQKLGVGT